jgi:hypothetical protein
MKTKVRDLLVVLLEIQALKAVQAIPGHGLEIINRIKGVF